VGGGIRKKKADIAQGAIGQKLDRSLRTGLELYEAANYKTRLKGGSARRLLGTVKPREKSNTGLSGKPGPHPLQNLAKGTSRETAFSAGGGGGRPNLRFFRIKGVHRVVTEATQGEKKRFQRECLRRKNHCDTCWKPISASLTLPRSSSRKQLLGGGGGAGKGIGSTQRDKNGDLSSVLPKK